MSEVLNLKPDFAGMIFYPKSPRYVGNNQSVDLKQKLTDTKKVGVFVNEDCNRIIQMVDIYNLDYVQLHGNESVDFCKQISAKVPVIKAFGISTKADFDKIGNYAQNVDYLLFDTKTACYGGSGQQFDWNMLQEVDIPQKFLLSGGISLESLNIIKDLKINNLVGVDLNSKFEDAPTLKNIEKLKQALNIIRK